MAVKQEWFERREHMLEAAAETARILAARGGSVGFCDPDDLQGDSVIEIRAIAVIEGKHTWARVDKGFKPTRGSALILERTLAGDVHDIRIVANDSGQEAPKKFGLTDARSFLSPFDYHFVELAIQRNLAHRKAHIGAKR